MTEETNSISIPQSNDTATEIIINDNIKVTIVADKFNEDGEMTVDYDKDVLTEEEVTEQVNSYFEALMNYMEKQKEFEQSKQSKQSYTSNVDTFDEGLETKIGEIGDLT
jgi:hypothetical protein